MKGFVTIKSKIPVKQLSELENVSLRKVSSNVLSKKVKRQQDPQESFLDSS